MRYYYPSARANIAMVTQGTDLRSLQDEDLLRLLAVKPKSLSVTHNDSHTADEWDMSLPVAHFNVDPRLISTLSAEIFIGDTTGLDRRLRTDQERAASLLGVLEELEKKYESNGESLVSLSGKDYSIFLLEPEWNGYVEMKGTLASVVEEVLGTFTATSRMRVLDLHEEPPSFPSGLSKMQRRFSAKKGATLWEGLAGLASRLGAIIEVRGDAVVVRPPQNTQAGASLPLMVAGRNLDNLSIKKNYGTEYAPNIAVQARDPKTWEVVEGIWPETQTEIARVLAKQGKQPEQVSSVEYRRFNIQHPAPTPDKLKAIARQVHERYTQQQLEVSFKTKEMRTWELPESAIGEQTLNTSEESFDLTRLRNGSAMRIFIDPSSRDILERATSRDQKRRQLEREGFEEQVAAELSEKWRVINAPFFVEQATHTIDSGTYSLSIKAMNKITASA